MIGVCTLNEAANIVPLIEGLRRAIPAAEILVVDDNSSDQTASLVEELAKHEDHLKLHVRVNERGLGSAIRFAMTRAMDGGYEYFLNLDGDLSHQPDQLPALLARAQQPPRVDVVIGSRYVNGGSIVGWPRHRRLMSRLVNRFATLCLRLPVRDCSGSMRCYRVEALREILPAISGVDGYAILEQVLIALHRRGGKMAEVPITFTDRRYGESKLTLREAIRSTRQILWMAIRRP